MVKTGRCTKGYSLVELVVTVAVIAIIAVVLVPNIGGNNTSGRSLDTYARQLANDVKFAQTRAIKTNKANAAQIAFRTTGWTITYEDPIGTTKTRAVNLPGTMSLAATLTSAGSSKSSVAFNPDGSTDQTGGNVRFTLNGVTKNVTISPIGSAFIN